MTIAFVTRNIKTVNNGHAAGEFTLGFDIHEMFRLRRDDRGIQGDGHRDRIRQGYPVFSRLLEESFLPAAVALDGKFGDGRSETQHLLYIGRIQYRCASTKVPADQFSGKA